MALDGSLEGLRSNYIDSIKGRKIAMGGPGWAEGPGGAAASVGQYLQGPAGYREVLSGVGAGTTILSTLATVALPPYGVSLVGSTLTSGSTGSSGTGGYFTLGDPVTGIRKTLICPSSAPAVVASTAAKLQSTGGSTYSQVTLAQGAFVELMGISTNLWMAVDLSQLSTGNGTATPVVFV